MSKTYYKAKLTYFYPDKTFIKRINHNYAYSFMTVENRTALGKYLYDMTPENFKTEKFLIEDKKINDILTEDIKPVIVKKDNDTTIIFEIIQDENGFMYAKEIYTRYLFPIVKMDDYDITYSASAMVWDRLRPPYVATGYSLKVQPIFKHKNENLSNLSIGVWNKDYAAALDDEVKTYLEKFKTKTIFGKEKTNISEIEKIVELSKKNIVRNQIKEKVITIIEREKNDETSKIVENIDFLLHKLDSINHELASIKLAEFERYLNSEQDLLTLSPLTIENLLNFEAELKLMIQFPNKKNEDIISFLNNILAEYDSNEKTVRNIEDIDKIAKIYFQTKSNYSIPTNRKATETLALIYIYEIYENKDTINLEDLVNSYFNDLLKIILICIDDMLKNGIIENDIIINYNTEITPDYILELIKQIKFKQKTNNKQKSIYNQK